MVELFDLAVQLVARTLDVELGAIFELQPGGDKMRLLAGVGWNEGCVGSVVGNAGSNLKPNRGSIPNGRRLDHLIDEGALDDGDAAARPWCKERRLRRHRRNIELLMDVWPLTPDRSLFLRRMR